MMVNSNTHGSKAFSFRMKGCGSSEGLSTEPNSTHRDSCTAPGREADRVPTADLCVSLTEGEIGRE